MTPLPDDELVTAVLDGEATDAQAATVAADPVLSARLEELRAVRRAVGAPTEPPEPAARDRAVAAALAAWSPDDLQRPPAGLAPPPPAAVATHRRRRWLVPAVAAAAVAAIVGVALVVDRGGSTSGTSTAAGGAVTTAADTAGGAAEAAPTTAASGADVSKGPAPTVSASGSTTTAGGPVVPAPEAAPPFLGALDTPDALRAEMAGVRNGVRAYPPATVLTPCAAPAAGAQLVGAAVWQGTPAYVFDVEGPPARALLLATLDCHLLADVPLT